MESVGLGEVRRGFLQLLRFLHEGHFGHFADFAALGSGSHGGLRLFKVHKSEKAGIKKSGRFT